MSFDEVIRCLEVVFLLIGYLVCVMKSSMILKRLEKMDKDKQELDDRPTGCMYCQHFDGTGCKITGTKFWSGMNVACRPKGCPLNKL